MMKMTRFAAFASVGLLAACVAGDGDGDRPCTGKCDDLGTRPALEAVELRDLAECRLVLDTSVDDPFFQVDRVLCKLAPLRSNDFVALGDIYADVPTSQNGFPNSRTFAGDELDGSEVEIGVISGDAYPATARLTFAVDTTTTGGSIDDPTTSPGWHYIGAQVAFDARPEADQSFSVPAPFDLWPVSLWPSEELEAAVPQVFRTRLDYAFPIESDDIIVGGVEPATEIRYKRDQFAINATSLTSLADKVFYVPVPKGATATPGPLRVFVDSLDGPAVETELDGPGYYVIAPDGSAVRTEPADLPSFGGNDADADAGTPSADAGTATPDADTATPDAAVDPCGGTCGAGDVCVDATCVDRSSQTQSSACYEPTRSCDAGEDADCAADHACVEGLCRRLSCQTQSSACYEPTRVCEGDDGDCAADHACVEGLCRRLSCQTQSSACYEPTRVCEGDDGDCAADHVCVEGLCRRLSCQTQSSACYPATRVCEGDDGDCAADHVCVDGLCQRETCLD